MNTFPSSTLGQTIEHHALTAERAMHTVFHTDLTGVHPEEEHFLCALGRYYPLQPHTEETRAAALALSSALHGVDHGKLTHFTQSPVLLPNDLAVRVHIKNTLKGFAGREEQTGISHVRIHVPPSAETRTQLASTATPAQATIDWLSTAHSVVFHHPDVMTNDPELAGMVLDYMTEDQLISTQFTNLATLMRQMGAPAPDSGWATLSPFTPPANAETGFNGTTTYNQVITSGVITEAAGDVTTSMMVATKNQTAFQNKLWTQQTGESVQVTDAPAPVAKMNVSFAAVPETEAWNATLSNTREIHGMQVVMSITDASARKIHLTFQNTYIRYLAAYIQFFDAEGQPLNLPDWSPEDGEFTEFVANLLDLQYDNLRYLGTMQPVNNVFAIPITADPGVLDVDIIFPENAVSATLYASGLGTGANPYPKTPLMGGIQTGVFNLGVPAFMLAAGTAAQAYKPLYDIVDKLGKDKRFLTTVILVGIGYFGAEFGIAASEKKMDWHAFATLAQLLFEQAATKALLWVEATMAAEEVANEIPFAGWIVLAIDIATGLAQLAETITEVATSPWNIQNNIALSITTEVTLFPDPRHKAFPQAGADPAVCTIKMIYQDQNRLTKTVQINVPGGAVPSLAAAFPLNTLGGKVKFEADFYIDNWMAGKATTGWMENDIDDVSQVTLYLVQYPIPLDSKSIYKHGAILTYQGGAYAWQNTAVAPTATITSANSSSTGNAMSVWSSLALNQRTGNIGFSWKAAGMGITSCASGQGGQLYGMQSINIPGATMSGVEFASCGLDAQTLVLFDPYPPKFEMGADGQWVLNAQGQPVPDPASTTVGNYYVDPRKAANPTSTDGGYHLRQIVLDPATPFNMAANQVSCGRFPFAPDSGILHPSGYAAAVNQAGNKIMITPITTPGVADADVPLARVYAGSATDPARPGLLFHPVAITCSYDGTLLVLEDTKASPSDKGPTVARIQAFDLYGNPVNRFSDATGQPSAFLDLAGQGDFTYLDATAVGDEKLTYIFVGYYEGDGSKAADYHLSIYEYGTTAPAANPLVTTDGIAAAELFVDMWHTLYTLNYSMTTDGHGNPAGPAGGPGTGPAGRTVPSVSEWLPPVPTTTVSN